MEKNNGQEGPIEAEEDGGEEAPHGPLLGESIYYGMEGGPYTLPQGGSHY